MYESKTFENILRGMLDSVLTQNPELDVREGSLIYNAIAPVALELETAYHEMDLILNETFIDTASKEGLVKLGAEVGVELHTAKSGHFKGEFDVDLEIGSRFSLSTFNYSVINKLADPTDDNEYYVFELICENEGSEPNDFFGDLIPITFVNNLKYAKLTSILIYGEDEEETEAYRYRLKAHINNPPIGGNVAQYNELIENYPNGGIGKYKILPCWNGLNTIKAMILSSENTAASDELIADVQQYLDPPTEGMEINDDVTRADYPQGRGMGDGEANIGAICTVDTVTEVPLVIDCQLKLKDGYTTPTGVQEAVENYLDSLVLNKTTIGYMPISAEIYNADSVEDVLKLTITINGVVMDKDSSPFIDSVTINSDEIAVLDTEHSVWGVA